MWAAIVIIVIALLLVLMAPKPKIENARAANLGDFQFPRSKEGDPVPWFRGTVRLRSPNSLWYGDYTPVAIKKKQKTGMFSSKKVTVGYKYHIGLDLCWAMGGANPVVLRKLWSDKYVFWQGTASTAQTISIAGKADLFGGVEQRGGLAGRIDFYPGTFNETRNSYLAQKADPDVPAYVGQARTVFYGDYVSNVPFEHPENYGITLASGFYFGTTTNINAISAEMSCMSSNVHPTYSIMPNGLDVNPMELLHAGFTQRFGMPGLDTSSIDMPSWQACAQTLYNEGFGMSLLVQQSITGKDLCEEVLRIADGILYQDTDSGKIIAKLIRNDYVVADLPVLDQSIVKELVNLNKTTWEQTYNQCRVTFKDRANDYADRAATAQDFANINFQQRVKNIDISVPGCFINNEANNLAVRQLSLLSVPLFQMELRCNRKASLMKPGDVFIFNWAPYGISNMVMRVQKIDKGTLADGTVTVHCVQDRFATALAVFAPPTGSGWTPITTAALPVAIRKIIEAPYWFSRFANVAPVTGQGLLMALASPPSGSSVEFDADLATSSDTAWSNPLRVLEDAPYYGSGLLTAAYSENVARTTGVDSTGFTLELIDRPQLIIDSAGTWDTTGQMLLMIDNEIMSAADVVQNSNGTHTFTGIRRALLDTDFENHAAGARCFFIQQADNAIEGYIADDVNWRMRLLDTTPNSTLDPALANTDVVTMTQRMRRAAPPDYVTINGSRTPTSVNTGVNVTVAWRERNRTNPALVAYNASSDTQEAGVDYAYRTRLNGGAWSSYTYVSGTSTSVAVGGTAGLWEVEVFSRRDGLLSRVGDRCSITLVALTALVQVVSASALPTLNVVDVTVSVTIPATAQVGDLLTLAVFARSAVTAPAGWTLINSATETLSGVNQTLYVYRRTCIAGDPGSVVTVTQATSARMGIQATVLRKPSGGTPAVVTSVKTDSMAASPFTIPPVTATVAGQLAMSFFSDTTNVDNNALTVSADFTQLTTVNQATNRLGVAHRTLNLGAASTGTWDHTSATQGMAVTVLFG